MNTKIPPPVFALALGFAMWLVDAYLPIGEFQFAGQALLAAVIAATGFVIANLAFFAFRRAGTTVNPMDPSQASHLVSGGVFQLSRNPMYLGLALVLIAWMLYLGSLLNILVLVFYVAYITAFQIKPEEQAMAELFGAEFEDYCKKVRRWI